MSPLAPGRIANRGRELLALGAGAHEEQALAGDRGGRGLGDALEAPELVALRVVADHDAAADRDDLGPQAVLPDEGRRPSRLQASFVGRTAHLPGHRPRPGVEGHEERLAFVVVELVHASLVDHRGRRRAEVEVDRAEGARSASRAASPRASSRRGPRCRRKRRRPALRPWPASPRRRCSCDAVLRRACRDEPRAARRPCRSAASTARTMVAHVLRLGGELDVAGHDALHHLVVGQPLLRRARRRSRCRRSRWRRP